MSVDCVNLFDYVYCRNQRFNQIDYVMLILWAVFDSMKVISSIYVPFATKTEVWCHLARVKRTVFYICIVGYL